MMEGIDDEMPTVMTKALRRVLVNFTVQELRDTQGRAR